MLSARYTVAATQMSKELALQKEETKTTASKENENSTLRLQKELRSFVQEIRTTLSSKDLNAEVRPLKKRLNTAVKGELPKLQFTKKENEEEEMEEPPVIKEGFMKKKGSNFLKGWQVR